MERCKQGLFFLGSNQFYEITSQRKSRTKVACLTQVFFYQQKLKTVFAVIVFFKIKKVETVA